jgi:hydrogenase expression/formation protein HypC
MEVIRIEGTRGVVRQSGVELVVALDLVDDVKVGDYVIVHAGFAIQAMPAAEAKETLAIFERLT